MLESVNYLVPRILKDKSDYDLRGTKNRTVNCNFNLIVWWFLMLLSLGPSLILRNYLVFTSPRSLVSIFFGGASQQIFNCSKSGIETM